MLLKLPSEGKIHWTKHSKEKMRQYQLSEKRVLRVLRHPDRKEMGVAPKTIALMQSTGTKKHPTEIWLMYQIASSKFKTQNSKLRQKSKLKQIRIISTWRYPAISPKGKPPIPEDTLDILGDLGII